ncbi:hypothetical protein COO91_01050 [Nostoc flagelliforme CCNUN1]|uniref:Uncharacterized protein n=1 Tax=Nostoc flagelliforme CCNUN1 TaxID=2038116 RepID=A0A2K8SK27_9NOSO|nr:hypothetical protein [Nostoc flagelliforme]AUB35185.1 hypothetical protein COO91_01050 [Nostoc flagelliforme CCNUN1]
MTTALKAINGGSKHRNERKLADAPTENPRVEETAHAPLRGASPSRIESATYQGINKMTTFKGTSGSDY